MKYVKNILRQDSIDGLAFQRYSRKKQDGQGDDILAGNSLAVVGLYQSIYGINPLYNRFYLNPHITAGIAGSKINYNYRGERLVIGLDMGQYSVSNKQFTVAAKTDFGFSSTANSLMYFNKHDADFSIKAKIVGIKHLDLSIEECAPKSMIWNQNSNGSGARVNYTINKLCPGAMYSIYADKKLLKKTKSDLKGSLAFDINGAAKEIQVSL